MRERRGDGGKVEPVSPDACLRIDVTKEVARCELSHPRQLHGEVRLGMAVGRQKRAVTGQRVPADRQRAGDEVLLQLAGGHLEGMDLPGELLDRILLT